MDELEKIKIYAQMLLEVVNQAEKKRYEEKATSSAAEEQKMLIDFSGVCVCSKPRSDGRYCGYYTYKGAKRYVYGKTVDEVKLKIEHFLKYGIPPKKKREKAPQKKKATPTVSEWLTKWAELYKAPNLKPKTMLGLRGCIKVISAAIGERQLGSLCTEDLQEFLLGIESARMRDLCRGYLQQAFRKAYLRGLIPRDPCEGLELKKHKYGHRSALTREQQTAFLTATENVALRPLLVFLLGTGLRIGEALALTFDDIDFTEQTVSVSKNVVFIDGKRIEQETPKSAAGVRVVPVPSEALHLLGEPRHGNELVFPVSYSGVHSCLRRMSASLGFTVTAHLLRHTYATRLEEAGISPKMKQYLMGHASLEMTQNVYTDVQPEYIKENAGRILSAFDNCLTTKTTENALGTH